MNINNIFFVPFTTQDKELANYQIHDIVDLEVLHNEIKSALNKKNINKEQLAYLIKVPSEQLDPLDTNFLEMSFHVLNKIIKALDIKVVIQLKIQDI
ncbi:MAG: hypothetical protein M3512_03080 [Bacteroidota bacterium]|nr:hypothetical protein [Bacteroidota bacterium]